MRQSVIGEPPNLIQDVTAKSAEIGRSMLDNAILRRLRLLNSLWNPPVTLLSTAETNWTLMTSDSIRR